jgi:D-sedoheptulose 7-phosphate isomerase
LHIYNLKGIMHKKKQGWNITGNIIEVLAQTLLDIKQEQGEQLSCIVIACLKAYDSGGRFFFAGNGGSAANANHFAADITKRPIWQIEGAKPIQAISLSANTEALTMWGNDSGFDEVFTRQFDSFKPGKKDMLFVFSGSGNSQNVLKLVERAKQAKVTIVGITGFGGGKLAGLVDISIVVPQTYLVGLGTDFNGAVMGEYEAITDNIMHGVLESFRMGVAAHVHGELDIQSLSV